MADAHFEGHYTGTAHADQTPLREIADSNVTWQRVGSRTARVSLGCPLPPQIPLAISNSTGDVCRTNQDNSLCAILVGNLPAGCTHKELKSHAKLAGTAPTWAVVYSHHDASAGAIGYDTPERAFNVIKTINGSLFQGTPILAASWTFDDTGHSIARACKYGAKCRGEGTYYIFAHASGQFPIDCIDNDILIEQLNDIDMQNQLGINLRTEISASDALRARENRLENEN